MRPEPGDIQTFYRRFKRVDLVRIERPGGAAGLFVYVWLCPPALQWRIIRETWWPTRDSWLSVRIIREIEDLEQVGEGDDG